MTSVAKGGFPGRPKKKVEKRRVRTYNPTVGSHTQINTIRLCNQIKNNLERFRVLFGDSDGDEEFLGFTREDCVRKVDGSSLVVLMHDVLHSPTDLKHRGLRTRLARTKHKVLSKGMRCGVHSSHRKTASEPRHRNEYDDVRNREEEQSHYQSSSKRPGFMKYKNSRLDFHGLCKTVGGRASSKTQLSGKPVVRLHKTSPIKPATFIAPSMTREPHQVTNVSPTCLKIKLATKDVENSTGPGHPKVLAKALLARANKRKKKGKTGLEPPMHTSTPIAGRSMSPKIKSKLFVLPTKSMRSSRIIKANKRYIEEDSENYSIITTDEQDIANDSNDTNNAVAESSQIDCYNQYHYCDEVQMPAISSSEPHSSYDLQKKGRPLLKQPTFRVAALENINNKPQPTRMVKEQNLSNRIRARRVIKRARFKHPTSSSTLVVGNDFEDDADRKKNLIREATFKVPVNGSKTTSIGYTKDVLPDLGISKQDWKKILKKDPRGEKDPHEWTKQEIHNVLHGANTFSNSWASVARQYDYHPSHQNWGSIKTKAMRLQKMGLLSRTLKVKSSILLQLRPLYASQEQWQKEAKQIADNDGGGKGKIKKGSSAIKKAGKIVQSQVPKKRKLLKLHSIKKISNTKSIYLGITRENFLKICIPQTAKKQPAWTVREIHNILHGIHVFGMGEWNTILSMYEFQRLHNMNGLKSRSKSLTLRGLLQWGKLKPNMLRYLQPKFSLEGKKYFNIQKKTKQDPLVEMQGDKADGKPKTESQRTKEGQLGGKEDSDITSPPRKQAYHLFGTAPVWDDGSTGQGMQMEGALTNRNTAGNISPSVGMTPMDRAFPNDEKITNAPNRTEASGLGKGKVTNVERDASDKTKSSGPRIKHVCRRASLVTGQKIAVYDDSSNPHLSALPKVERERIAAEVERLRELAEDTSASSDSELDLPVMANKKQQQIATKKERMKGSQTQHISTKSEIFSKDGKRCRICRMCKIPACGDCDQCRNSWKSSSNSNCVRRPPCRNPIRSDGLSRREQVERTGTAVCVTSCDSKSMTIPKPLQINKSSLGANSQADVTRPNNSIVLSPDSRHHLLQELQMRDALLPSIAKMEEWKERYEVEDIWKMGGVSLITSVTQSTPYLCFLCGSLGRGNPARALPSTSSSSSSLSKSDTPHYSMPLFIFCLSCCEPFHPFCLDDHEQQAAIADAKKGVWICRRCRYCHVCGRPENLLECKRCNKTYHSACLGPSYPTKPSKNQVWVCMRCVRCRSCGTSRPGRRPGSKWTHDFQFCQRCGDLFDKGNFCPICRRCYRDEDYDSRMVQCGTCKRWVHSRCESLTIEMYTLLSHLPDDVQYICPDCDGRRAKVESEMCHMENFLNEEPNNESLEGDKMRSMLAKLTSPPWKKTIEKAIQSGIETVTMSLFHSKEAACILKSTGISSKENAEDERDRPNDLFAVRFSVHNRKYGSVSEFSSDVCSILDSVADSAEMATERKSSRTRQNDSGVRKAFSKEMHEVFPWFDVETGRVHDSSDVPEDLLPNATLPPHIDHEYAQWQDRDISLTTAGPDTPLKNENSYVDDSPSKIEEIGLVLWGSLSRRQFDDMRQCLFCGKYGDDSANNAGRLLYCGQDEWVHVNCALWSAEVFERHDGSLQNVHSAISRGRMMKCELCKLPGATVGCNTRDCPQNYHFPCARAANCSFQDDKKVFCTRHARSVDSELLSEDCFEVVRRVVVDNDEMRPNRRWQRGINTGLITVLIGAATVHNLGHLTLASDSRDYLIPISFRLTRVYWSAVNAGRRVRYTITVSDKKQSLDSEGSMGLGSPREGKQDAHKNHTISHADDDKPVFASPPKKSHYPGADSCKSRLVDRLGPSATTLTLSKKPQPHTVTELSRPSRQQSSNYTVVGIGNTTLPQTITPLPSLTPSPATHINADKFNTENHKRTLENQLAILQKQIVSNPTPFTVSSNNPYLNLPTNISLSLNMNSTHLIAQNSCFRNYSLENVIVKPNKISITSPVTLSDSPIFNHSNPEFPRTANTGFVQSCSFGTSGSILTNLAMMASANQQPPTVIHDSNLHATSTAIREAKQLKEKYQPSITSDYVTHSKDPIVPSSVISNERNTTTVVNLPLQEATMTSCTDLKVEVTAPLKNNLSSPKESPNSDTIKDSSVSDHLDPMEEKLTEKPETENSNVNMSCSNTNTNLTEPKKLSLFKSAREASEKEDSCDSSSKTRSSEEPLWWKRSSNKDSVTSKLGPVPTSMLCFHHSRNRRKKKASPYPEDLSLSDDDYNPKQDETKGKPFWKRNLNDITKESVEGERKVMTRSQDLKHSNEIHVTDNNVSEEKLKRMSSSPNADEVAQPDKNKENNMRTPASTTDSLSSTFDSLENVTSGSTGIIGPAASEMMSLRKYARETEGAVVNGFNQEITEENKEGIKSCCDLSLSENFQVSEKAERLRSKSSDQVPRNLAKNIRRRNRSSNETASSKDRNQCSESQQSFSESKKYSSSKEIRKKRQRRVLSMLKTDTESSVIVTKGRRYPRRNSSSCLKSFSGLSPSYAVQSYTSKDHSRSDRAMARSNNLTIKVKKKYKFGKQATSVTKNDATVISKDNALTVKSPTSFNPDIRGLKEDSQNDNAPTLLVPDQVAEAKKTSNTSKPLSVNITEVNAVLPDPLEPLEETPCIEKPEVQWKSCDVIDKEIECSENLNVVGRIEYQKSHELHGLHNGGVELNKFSDSSNTITKSRLDNKADAIGNDNQCPVESIIQSSIDSHIYTSNLSAEEDDSIEVPRGAIEDDEEKQKNAPDGGRAVLQDTSQNFQDTDTTDRQSSQLSISDMQLLNPSQSSFATVSSPNITSRSTLNYEMLREPISPLSPSRDDPDLPLPMDTAPFMVTSECPILNADEVQSLLDLPGGTTTSCDMGNQMTPTTSQMYLQQQVHNRTIADPQQYSYIHKGQTNETYMPVTYITGLQQSPVILYPNQMIPTYVQQPANVAAIPLTQNSALPYALRMSGGNSNYEPSSQIIFSTPGNLAQVNQNYLPQAYYQTPVPMTNTSQVQTTRPIAMNNQNPTYLNNAHVKQSQLQPQQNKDSKLETDQVKLLEEMIEFYSNKNKLSTEEKAMVRAIISEQIQNKFLPLPAVNKPQDTPDLYAQTNYNDPHCGPNTECMYVRPGQDVNSKTMESHRPTILSHKRSYCYQDSDVPTQKRPRKNKHIVKEARDQYKELLDQYGDAAEDLHSPLLNIYLEAVHSEHIACEKSTKKWRDVLRVMSRHNVHIDVPWSLKRHNKGNKEIKLPPPPPPPQNSKRQQLVFEISSEDGYYAKGIDLPELITNLLDTVQECRSNAHFATTPLCLASVLTPHSFLGISHDAVRFLVEQLPGARHCPRYRAKYHKHREPPEEVVTHINPHGCARAEKYQGRSKPDMFSFLASKHRFPPNYNPSRSQNVEMQQTSTRRPTSMELPMAMRFRHLKTFAREAVGVYRSPIHGRGLFCKRDIEAGEMVMEYTGEAIRGIMTDHREKMYEKKGIGCYMFRMDDMYVVDATMTGSGARFINHSCEPSCYSRIVNIDGKKHIIIFALKKIYRGEELTYDYKFPIEADDQKIMCNCGAKTCRKHMN